MKRIKNKSDIKKKALMMIAYQIPVKTVAYFLGIARETFYYWLATDPDFKKQYEQLKNFTHPIYGNDTDTQEGN